MTGGGGGGGKGGVGGHCCSFSAPASGSASSASVFRFEVLGEGVTGAEATEEASDDPEAALGLVDIFWAVT